MSVIHLISHQNWHRDELAVAETWSVDHSYGTDVPEYDVKEAWWLPQAQAVQLLQAIKHYSLPTPSFIAPTPNLLDTVPAHLLGRRVETLKVIDATATLIDWPDLWWKLATAKHDEFQAQYRTHDELIHAIQKNHLPEDAFLQNSTSLPEIISEYRFFIAKKSNQYVIMTSSGYLRNGVTVYDGAEFIETETEAAYSVVEELLDVEDILLPPSFVVDVAVTVDGAFILEFNPSWCSGWYNCDVTKVLETIERGFKASKAENKKWGYEPDETLIRQYANPARRIWPKK